MNLYRLIIIIGLLYAHSVSAWTWRDFWQTKDHQAEVMMQKGEFAKAKDIFERDDWRATAAFRAGHYKEAAQLFGNLDDLDGYYNQGNALAYAQQYAEAIKAYDHALAIKPDEPDVVHNRKVVEELLKQQQQQNQQQDKQNSDQDKSQQSQSDQQQNQDSNQKQDKSDQQQSQNEQSEPQQDQSQEEKSEQDKNPQTESNVQDEQVKQEPATPEQDKTQQMAQEQEQAKEQWLRLIPDDPGGLLREKFLRDYLRRQ